MSKQPTNPLMRPKKKYDSPLRRDRPSLRPQLRKTPINVPVMAGHKFTQQNNVGEASQKTQTEPKYKEYSLVAASKDELTDLRYHIMRLHSIKSVDPASDFTPPVKLHRKDPRNLQFQATQEEQAAAAESSEGGTPGLDGEGQAGEKRQQADLSKIAPDGGARHAKKNQFNKRAKQVVHRDEEAKKLRYEEYYPWVLEDYSGKNTWVGNYEAAQSDSYCVFVFHGNGFKMVPIEKFYKFTPRNQYATLTLEEAEKRMADNVKSSTPRWLMKHLAPEIQQSRMRDQRPRRLQTVDSGGGPADDEDGLARRRERDDEDLDFDHVFDDDEEAPIMEGAEEDQKEVERKIKNEHRSAAVLKDDDNDDMGDLFGEDEEEKMDKEGRKLKKYLRSLEKNTHYDSDDDENPYASSEEEEDDDHNIVKKEDPIKKEENLSLMDEQPLPLFVKKNITGLPSGMAVIQLPPHILAKFTRGVWNPNAKRRSSITTDDASNAKRIKTEDGEYPRPFGPDDTVLTDEIILNVIRTRPPMTVQELLRVLMPIMRKDADNKARLTTCLKRSAKVQNGVLVLR